MRLLFAVVLFLVLFGLVGFAVENPDVRVPVSIGSTTYPAVQLFVVVFVAFACGVMATALIALVEGTGARMANRRLRRNLERQEAALGTARAQSEFARRGEPDALDREPSSGARPAPQRVPREFPSAPVYQPVEADPRDNSEDDDPYSGGRAV